MIRRKGRPLNDPAELIETQARSLREGLAALEVHHARLGPTMLGKSDPAIVEVNKRALAELEALVSVNAKSL